ncbi:MAG: 2-aminoethylphosphonate--pyruvate transaminase [Rectinemataceae bacterium]|jgi:2-aminoethylphosphonate--pyruvate transaminase/phosphonoacetaldehyde hydrolase
MSGKASRLRNVQAVVLDWAGTAVDFGSIAPVQAFVRAFEAFGLYPTMAEVRSFMGRAKRDHVRALLGLESQRERWKSLRGREPDEEDVDELYTAVEDLLHTIAAERCEPIPGLVDFVSALRAAGARIGSTTGYSSEVMAAVVEASARAGYRADCVACPRPGTPGSPAPWLLFECARQLGVYPMDRIVKIGDTAADMEEARNAGTWAVGLSMSGNECGLDLDEYRSLDGGRAHEIRQAAAARLFDAGAHFVVDGPWDCMAVVEKIDELMGAGIRYGAVPDNPYLLLTPGPLSTSKGVRAAMLRDWCTWDRDYNDLVRELRNRLVSLLGPKAGEDYSAIPMQGSGTFAVEAALTSLVPREGRLLVLANGAYGRRMAETARRCGIEVVEKYVGELKVTEPGELAEILARDSSLTHVGAVHVETTTGILNPAAEWARVARANGRVFILDAMSSLGGMPMDALTIPADVFVSSANKCLQGVPGFAFVIARRKLLEASGGRARSLSLDLFDQWKSFEEGGGKWRFTSPTHVVRALVKALDELDEEGGVLARHARYCENRDVMLQEIEGSGFKALLPAPLCSPIITSILYPEDPSWSFDAFYERLKQKGFVLYPGKISEARTFRIGTIGHVFPRDFHALGTAVRETLAELFPRLVRDR